MKSVNFQVLKRRLEHVYRIDVEVLILYTHCMKSSTERRWDWPSSILLLLMLQVATARLVVTQWTDFLFFSQTLAALGLSLGLALGYSYFKRKTVFWLALGYSVMLIPWQLTLAIEDDLLSGRLASVGGRLFFSIGTVSPPPTGRRRPVICGFYFDRGLAHQPYLRLLVDKAQELSGRCFTRRYLYAHYPSLRPIL